MSRDSRQKFIEAIRSHDAFEGSNSTLFEIDSFKQVCLIADPFTDIENFKLYCQGLLSKSTADEVIKKCSLTEQFTVDEAGKFGDIYFDKKKTLLLKVFKKVSNSFRDICNELFIYLFLTFVWKEKAVFPRILKWNCEFVMMVFVEGTPLKSISEIQRNRIQFGNLVKILSAMSILGISHGDLNPGNILVDSDDKVFLLDFGFSEINRPLNDIKKFDLGDIHSHFEMIFTADENKLIRDIIKDVDDPTSIYNTLNSLFHENGGIIVPMRTTTGKLIIVDFPCRTTFKYINGELIFTSILEGCNYSLSRKNSIPRIMFMNDDSTFELQGPVTVEVLRVNNDDIWKNRAEFVSQFAINILNPTVSHDDALFEENSYIHVSSTPSALRKIDDDFINFCQDKYTTCSFDELVKEYNLTECMAAITDDGSYVNYFQDVEKTYVLKRFSDSKLKDEICNELFIFLCLLSYAVPVFPTLIAWNLNFVLLKFHNATPITTVWKNQINRNHFGNTLMILIPFSLLKLSSCNFDLSDVIVNPSESGEVFILNFGISKVNEQSVKKEDKEDIRFVIEKFGFLFSSEENDSMRYILEKEDNLSRIYNTFNSGYRDNGDVLITIKNHTGDQLQFFPLQARKIIEGDDLYCLLLF